MLRPRRSPSPRTLAPGAYRLRLVYSGKIHTQANGLFALDYKNTEGKDARSLFTQFEAADARRFVPSWDEPDYKATWDLTARVPANTMAVSNMPAASSGQLAGGLKEVRFQTTPTMSSYLVVLRRRRFRPHHQALRRPRGRHRRVTRQWVARRSFALDAEAEILPYYNDYFGTPYPTAEARQCRRPRPVAVLRRDGELGRDFHLRIAICSMIPRSPAKASAREFSAPRRMKWRTSGSATW